MLEIDSKLFLKKIKIYERGKLVRIFRKNKEKLILNGFFRSNKEFVFKFPHVHL